MPTDRTWLLSRELTLVLAAATNAASATPLQISATARAAMAQPTPAPGSEDLVNGDDTAFSNPDWANNFHRNGDGVSGVFPLWNLGNAMTGVAGEWSRATFTTPLVGGLGMNGAQLFGWPAGHGIRFPMVFAADAVAESTLALRAAPVPGPATAATLAAGLAGAALLLARCRPVPRSPRRA